VIDGIRNVQAGGCRTSPKDPGNSRSASGARIAGSRGHLPSNVPFQDLRVTYVPNDSHATFDKNGRFQSITFTPAIPNRKPEGAPVWPVTDSTADTILDLQVLYEGSQSRSSSLSWLLVFG
jgi:hypothetical protein